MTRTLSPVELSIDDPRVRELAHVGKRGLEAGAFIGYVLTKAGGVQVWIGGQVVANDREAGLIVIHNSSLEFDTLDYQHDAIVQWPDDEPLARELAPELEELARLGEPPRRQPARENRNGHACPSCGTNHPQDFRLEKGGLAGHCDDCADLRAEADR